MLCLPDRPTPLPDQSSLRSPIGGLHPCHNAGLLCCCCRCCCSCSCCSCSAAAPVLLLCLARCCLGPGPPSRLRYCSGPSPIQLVIASLHSCCNTGCAARDSCSFWFLGVLSRPFRMPMPSHAARGVALLALSWDLLGAEGNECELQPYTAVKIHEGNDKATRYLCMILATWALATMALLGDIWVRVRRHCDAGGAAPCSNTGAWRQDAGVQCGSGRQPEVDSGDWSGRPPEVVWTTSGECFHVLAACPALKSAAVKNTRRHRACSRCTGWPRP